MTRVWAADSLGFGVCCLCLVTLYTTISPLSLPPRVISVHQLISWKSQPGSGVRSSSCCFSQVFLMQGFTLLSCWTDIILRFIPTLSRFVFGVSGFDWINSSITISLVMRWQAGINPLCSASLFLYSVESGFTNNTFVDSDPFLFPLYRATSLSQCRFFRAGSRHHRESSPPYLGFLHKSGIWAEGSWCINFL